MTDTSKFFDSSTHTYAPSDKFRQQLHNALSKIEITPELTIVHPGYEFPAISQTYRAYIQQMSPINRDRYLILKLQRHLYDLFMGRKQPYMAISSQAIVNSGDRWYETEFYQQLLQSNHGKGYGDYDWVVVGKCDRGWQVTKNDLNLFIDPQLHLHEPLAKLSVGQTVCLKMPTNLIARGVYIAIGDAGSVNSTPPRNGGANAPSAPAVRLPPEGAAALPVVLRRSGQMPCKQRTFRPHVGACVHFVNTQCSSASSVWQIYFNVDAKTALILLDSLSRQLNHLSIPFDFRLAYSDRDYQYLDAAILEFKSENWQQLQPIIFQIYAQNQAGFRSEVPFFCQLVRDGLGIAAKPELIPTESTTGLKHSKFIAEVIVESLKHSNILLEDSTNCIFKYLETYKAVL